MVCISIVIGMVWYAFIMSMVCMGKGVHFLAIVCFHWKLYGMHWKWQWKWYAMVWFALEMEMEMVCIASGNGMV
jgi:hypothetical protein